MLMVVTQLLPSWTRFAEGANAGALYEAPLVAATNPSPPDLIVDSQHPISKWTVGGDMVYWVEGVPDPDGVFGPKKAESRLRRMPIAGGDTRTLATFIQPNPPCPAFRGLAADATAVFYANACQGQIEMIAVDRPGDPPTVLATGVDGMSTKLVSHDGYVFWGRDDNRIQRVAMSGGSVETVIATSAAPLDLGIDGGGLLYWVGADGAWIAPGSCTSCGQADSDRIWSRPGSILNVDGVGPAGVISFLVVDNNPLPDADVILSVSLFDTGAQAFPVAVGLPGGDIEAIDLGLGAPVPFGGSFAPNAIYWIDSFENGDDVLSRQALGDDTPEFLWTASAGGANSLGDRVIVHDSGVFFTDGTFADQRRILRLAADVAGLPGERDLAATAMEMTQAIQSLENDVPLIEARPTFVRLYGQHLSGSLQVPAEAWLEGFDASGAPLPGSPLKPIHVPPRLVTGERINRADDSPKTRSDWAFQLPREWYAEQGSVTLKGIIDPRHVFDDPNRSNNEWTDAVSFHPPLDKVCLIVQSVVTEATLVADGTDFRQLIAGFESLWPVGKVSVLWVTEPLYRSDSAAFDLSTARGVQTLFDKMRAVSRLIPADKCRPAPSQSFYIGVVHRNANTLDDLLGAAQNGVVWAKADPEAGPVLAHEVSHILGFKHLGCTDDEIEHGTLEPDGYYYDDKCALDDGDWYAPSTHFGYDGLSDVAMRPSSTRDFMAYGTPAWVSDITYNRLIRELGGVAPPGGTARTMTMSIPSSQFSSAATAGPLMTISGSYDIETGLGRLDYVALLPPSSALLTDQRDASRPDAVPGVLRLVSPQGVAISGYDIVLIPADDIGSHQLAFSHSISPPVETVERVELLVDGQVVAARAVSANQPATTILAPQPGDILNGSIVLRWQTSDADNDYLHFTIHYSQDDGQTWLPLVSSLYGYADEPFEHVLENAAGLPGTDGASGRIRIITSDGYHSHIAEAPSLTIPQRGPTALILEPQANASLPAGRPVQIRGEGVDPEDGSVPDAALNWMLNGAPVGSGPKRALEGLAPGAYTLSLDVVDSNGAHGDNTVAFSVLPVGLPISSQSLSLDGLCHEVAYLSAQVLNLSEYEGGGQAGASLLVQDGFLWVCARGLARGDGDLSSAFNLLIDSNLSRDGVMQQDDFAFRVFEDGTPQLFAGNGNGGLIQMGLGEFSSRSAAAAQTWSVEMRIPLNSSDLGFSLAHGDFNQNGGSVQWPHAAQTGAPSSWATAALGSMPFVDLLEPDRVEAGQPGADIQILGSGFGASPLVFWNDQPLPVVAASDTAIRVHANESLLQQAGVAAISVQSGFRSNTVPFEVVAPPSPLPPQPCQLYPIGLPLNTVQNAEAGMRITLGQNDAAGNGVWLTWTGNNSVDTLAQSLRPPGNNQAYINPNDPNDHTLSRGNWVQGLPGIKSSNKVRAALDDLLGLPITAPVWTEMRGQGATARYRVVDFVELSLIGHDLQGSGSIYAIYRDAASCGDSDSADSLQSAADNCPPVANAGQANACSAQTIFLPLIVQ
jgi:hypothetical protein